MINIFVKFFRKKRIDYKIKKLELDCARAFSDYRNNIIDYDTYNKTYANLQTLLEQRLKIVNK